MLKDLRELEKDINFIKSELENNLSNEDKTLLLLLNIKQKILCNLAYIQGAEAISEGIASAINKSQKGGNK